MLSTKHTTMCPRDSGVPLVSVMILLFKKKKKTHKKISRLADTSMNKKTLSLIKTLTKFYHVKLNAREAEKAALAPGHTIPSACWITMTPGQFLCPS